MKSLSKHTHPVWKQRIDRSLHLGRSKHETKYFQLASLDHEGFPCVRTVVFRGFDEQDNIYAVTDRRSDKYEQFMQKPNGQICWYFAKTREQFRFSIKVECIENGGLYKEYWDKLSPSARSAFFGPCPKVPISFSDNENDENGSKSETSNEISVHFVLLKFVVSKCDYLDLKAKPQVREIEVRDISDGIIIWSNEKVNA